MIVRQNHVQTLENENKSALSMLHFAFSKRPGLLWPSIGCTTQKNHKKISIAHSKTETKTDPKLSPLIMEDQGACSIAIEDHDVNKTNTCIEMDGFENIAANTSVELMGVNVNLSHCSKSTLFSQASHINVDSNDKCLEALANLNLKIPHYKVKMTWCCIS